MMMVSQSKQKQASDVKASLVIINKQSKPASKAKFCFSFSNA